jgi:hypothetical protein
MKTRTRRILSAINDAMEVTHDCEAAARSVTTLLSAGMNLDRRLLVLIETYAALRFTHRRLAALGNVTVDPINDTAGAWDLRCKRLRASDRYAAAINQEMHYVLDSLTAALEALP